MKSCGDNTLQSSAQVTEMGSPGRIPRRSKGFFYKEANDLLGNIVKVTPTQKGVGR